MDLKPGEYICEKCNGKGQIIKRALVIHKMVFNKRDRFINCEHCDGAGKLDWVENVVGKRPKCVIWGQKTLKPRSRKLKPGWTIECN